MLIVTYKGDKSCCDQVCWLAKALR